MFNAYVAPIEDINYTEHESIKKTCNTSGTPVSSVFWTMVGSNRRWEGKTLNFCSVFMLDEGEYRCETVSEKCNNGNQTTFISKHRKALCRVALCYQLCYQFFLCSMKVTGFYKYPCFSRNIVAQVNIDFLKLL